MVGLPSIRVWGDRLLASEPEVTVRVGDDGSTEEFGPVRSRDRERDDHHSADAVGASLGDYAVEDGSRRKREEGCAVSASAGGAGGAIPVVDFESVLRPGPGFRVACENRGRREWDPEARASTVSSHPRLWASKSA